MRRKSLCDINLGTDLTFWVLAVLLFVTVIYSTSIQLFWFWEHTLDPYYFVNKDFTGFVGERFKDAGQLSPENLDFGKQNAWKITTFPTDSIAYMDQATDLRSAGPPFRYRLVGMTIVRAIVAFTGRDPAFAYVIMNFACALMVGLGFTAYLNRWHSFSRPVSLLGGLLAVTSLSMMRTLPFPMLEPLSMVMSLLLFWSLRHPGPTRFLFISTFSILTKEVFLFSAPLWFVHSSLHKPIISLPNMRTLLIGVFPILVFLGVRHALGGSLVEVDYGFNLVAGELPSYYKRLWPFRELMGFAKCCFLAFGFLWIGLFEGRRDKFLLRSSLVAVPMVVLAAGLFSDHIIRPLGVLYPVVIPGFLALMFPGIVKREDRG